MTVLERERQASGLGSEEFQETHAGPPPFTHALCGEPRGDRPLRPGAEVTCVLCRDGMGLPT